MKLPFIPLLKIILEGKSSWRFLIGVVGSFSFSIAVILCTIGLMDGFESTLVKSLHKSGGDLTLKSREGFFHFDDELKNLTQLDTVEAITPIIQVEAFFIAKGQSKGVLVRGIDEESFDQVTSLNIKAPSDGLVIGKELASKLNLKIGDEIVLTFASKSKKNQGSPILKSFKISGLVAHGVYEKDLRFVYVNRDELIKTFNYKEDLSNIALIKVIPYDDFDTLDALEMSISNKLPETYKVETFWSEFKTLLDAVEIEKFSISLILQLIVVVAIFNIIAFIIFISERKSQEFFLLRVLGLTLNTVIKFWLLTLVIVWFISSIISIGLTFIFNLLLTHLPVFELPGDIYVLSKLQIELTSFDYLLVFGLALLWVILIGVLAILKMKKKTLLQGLRQEFS